MKAILLAGGKGTRLYPMTRPVSKPLIPIYDKPLIYYPLSILLEAGVQELLLIVPPGQREPFEDLLGDGSRLGVRLVYREQTRLRGVADALLVGADFIGSEPVCLMLGDNIFHGEAFRSALRSGLTLQRGARIFALRVEDPRPFGVVELDADGRPIRLEEKPLQPRSHYAVPGCYLYDRSAVAFARSLQPSARGELEITDLNRRYLEAGLLQVTVLEGGVTWIDAGSADAVLDASLLVRALERREGREIGCIEEAALKSGFVTRAEVHAQGAAMANTAYGAYLMGL